MSGQADEGGFLGRWSRRKRQAEADAAPADTPPVEDAASVPPVSAMDAPDPVTAATVPPDGTEEPGEDPYVRFKLPRLEDLTADTNIALFMQRGVPDAIRNAALRKMWALVPAIRDFRTRAEYDFDWNTPGGAPGYGPLTESDNVAEMVERLLGHRKSPEERARESAELAQKSTDVAGEPALDAPMSVENRTDCGEAGEGEAPQDPPPAVAAPANAVRLSSPEVAVPQATSAPDVPVEQADYADRAVRPARRRHGGAAPV